MTSNDIIEIVNGKFNVEKMPNTERSENAERCLWSYTLEEKN